MSEPCFFPRALHPTLAEIIAWTGAKAPEGADLLLRVGGAAPFEEAEPGELACLERLEGDARIARTRATACFVAPQRQALIAQPTVALVTQEPGRALSLALARMFPAATRPASLFATTGVNPGASVHPEARIEPGVIIDPGVVIGPRAEIGSGSVIAANAVIGPDVRIGRGCSIGAQVTIGHAFIGDRVVLHPGARIGHSGLEFPGSLRPSDERRLKTPQIGRVIIQDDVEIGANCAIERGAARDTVIGEGANIGGLVQIAHDAMIGRHSLIRAQAAVGESAEIGDFAAVEGQARLSPRVRVGRCALVLAQSSVASHVPPRALFCGAPARPLREWLRFAARLGWRRDRDSYAGQISSS